VSNGVVTANPWRALFSVSRHAPLNQRHGEGCEADDHHEDAATPVPGIKVKRDMINNSTPWLTDDDLNSTAIYLVSLLASEVANLRKSTDAASD
jgi:hypothetical protein